MAVKLYRFQLTPRSSSSHGLPSARSIALATDASLSSSGRPSSPRRGRLGRSDGRTGGRHSVGETSADGGEPSLLSLAEPGAAPPSGERPPAPRRSEVRIPSAPPG